MYRVEPLTPDRWDDFAGLCRAMGPNRSCWCLWWRDDGTRPSSSARTRARALVETGRPVGLLAYAEDAGSGAGAVGWVAVAPRADFPRLNRGRDTAPVDDTAGVWAMPCFFVRSEHRNAGVTRTLLAGAVAFAAAAGARVAEGVPVDPATKKRTDAASYTGSVGLFAAAGFDEVARRTPKGRVVMRRYLDS